MKFKQKESGQLVVEASLSLMFFSFFLLLVWSFSGVFVAQNVVSHAAMQAAQSISIDNMSKSMFASMNEQFGDVVQKVDDFLKPFNNGESVLDDKLDFFYSFATKSNKSKEIEDSFYYMIGGSVEDGKAIAKKKGIDVDHLRIEVDETAARSGIVKFKVHYQVRLRYAFFGVDQLKLVKCVECRLFGYRQ